MRIWLPLAIIGVLCVVGVLFAFGVFDTAPNEETLTDTPGIIPRSVGDVERPALMGAGDSEPDDQPEIVPFAFKQPLNVLVLLTGTQRFPAFLAQRWGKADNVHVRVWSVPVETRGGAAAMSMPHAMDTKPAADIFETGAIDVLVVHDLDPALFDDAFWEAAVERVQDGRLGLIVLPGLLHGKAMVEHAELKKVMPVASVAEIRGSNPPGIFPASAPFRVTAEGLTHPASRLVPYPTWSRRLWDATRLETTPWGTRFCYPVTGVVDGAVVLLEVEPAQAERVAALIVGPLSNGQVLWYGAWDLGEVDAYGRPRVVRSWSALVTAWLAWASGRSPI